MARSTTSELVIDLTLPPEARFVEAGLEQRKVLKRLLKQFRRVVDDEVATLPAPVRWAVRALESSLRVTGILYADHPYIAELHGYAKGADVDPHELYVANLAYDITSMSSGPGLFGCTGVVFGGTPHPVIARNMDWDTPAGIGKHTTLYRFRSADHEYVSVGFPGVTGVISGISSRGFGLTVNQASELRVPNPTALPALWLTRSVFDDATSYRSALRAIGETSSVASFFALVAGTKSGEACLLESFSGGDTIRRVRSGATQVVANTGVDSLLAQGEGDVADEQEEDFSLTRHVALEREVERFLDQGGQPGASAKACLARYPVKHEDTVHQMTLVPAIGELHLRCPQQGETKYQRVVVGRDV